MTRGWLSIALACAFGAFIGSLASMEIAARFGLFGHYAWGIGALFGGVVAYVAIDFRHLCAGIVHSYHRTIAWRPDTLYWKTAFVSFGGVAVMYNSIVGMGGGFVMYITDDGFKFVAVYAVLSASVVVTLLAFAFGLAIASSSSGAKNRLEHLQKSRDFGWLLMKQANPIAMLYWMFFGTIWVAVRAPSFIVTGKTAIVWGISHVVRTLTQFVAGVFIYVHSKRRTLCFVDAALGAAIGYSFGSAIIGAIAGAVLGIINYEVVSVRWLKLNPAKARIH